MAVLSIDAGTSGVTALFISESGQVLSRGHDEFPQHFPQDGWVEHAPDQIWSSVLAAVSQALQGTSEPPTVMGITNQRETVVLWDREALTAPRPAIVWQDRRSSGICERLRQDGHEALVREVSGLRLDPYFSATKLSWIRDNEAEIWKGVLDGRIVFGTVDSYLITRMTGGRLHVTDASNASRTLLFDLRTCEWSSQLCGLFGVPINRLPQVVPSFGVLGNTDPDAFLGLSIPIAGVAGDQQAALFGQTCFAPGTTKCTYGTGSFVLTNTGSSIVSTQSGLLTTVAWVAPDGTTTYALEGSIFVTGAAVQWLRDGLKILDNADDSEALARSVPDSGGVVFVPALTGMGAPDWDPAARGAIFGITRATTRGHIARATLEAIAFEVRDVVDLMTEEAQVAVPSLAVDGGGCANNLLCQLQADELGIPVLRPTVIDTTALGAAFLAGLGSGVWSSIDELNDTWQLQRQFDPEPRDERAHRRWRSAVGRATGWAADP